MRCAEVDNLIQAYLDGELVGEEAASVERHVAGCADCRERVAFQTHFKADLRAKLRSRFARPEPPARLLANVRAGLDQADLRRGWRQAAPFGALVAAATVAMVFGLSSRGDSAIVEEAIDAHVKNLPVEVGGGTAATSDEEIAVWMRDKVPVPVRPPLRRIKIKLVGDPGNLEPTVEMIGARLYHLRNRDAGQIRYRVGRSPVSVFVFDPSGFEFSATQRRIVSGRDVYLSVERGYSVALYRDRGIGYAVTSDMSPDELMRLVEASFSP